MISKVERYLVGVIEGTWYFALILAPLFFNVFSARIFEPDKIALTRTLSLIILAITLSIFINQIFKQGIQNYFRRSFIPTLKETMRNPLVIFVLGFLIINLISTFFSVTPNTSFWGSYQRLQGSYTTISYLILFASIYWFLRSKEQIEKIVTIAIVTSLPVSLYGIIQRLGLDPIEWAGNVTTRITANMGNSIFIAAFLIMVFPLTLRRIIEALNNILLKEEKNLSRYFLSASLYIMIAVVQLVAIYYSGSRGPWLGLGTGIFIFGLGAAIIWKKRWLAITGVFLAVIAALFLILLNIPNGPLQSVRELPGVGRLGQLFDAESRTGKVRTLIWQGAAELVLPHEPLAYPDNNLDNYNILRPFIGYGPESMYVAYNRFYQSDLTLVEKRNASPDRSHNEVWDSLVFTGLIGLIIFLGLFTTVFYLGFKWIGFIESKKQIYFFITSMLSGGLLGSIITFFYKGFSFIGVGLPFGIVLGIIVFIIYKALFFRTIHEKNHVSKTIQLVILSLLSIFLAHFVELIFGFGIVSTRVYFWTFLGIFTVLGIRKIDFEKSDDEFQESKHFPQKNKESTPKQIRLKSKGFSGSKRSLSGQKKQRNFFFYGIQLKTVIISGLITGLILTTLAFDFISLNQNAKDSLTLFTSSIFPKIFNSGNINYGTFLIIVITWIVVNYLVYSQLNENLPGRNFLPGFSISMAFSMLIFIVYALWHANGLAFFSNLSIKTIDEIGRYIGIYQLIPMRFFITVLILLFVISFGLSELSNHKTHLDSLYFISPLLIILALFFSYMSNIKIIQADMAFKAADSFTKPGLWQVAITVYKNAIKLAPKEDYYYLFLAKASLEQARDIEDKSLRHEFFQQAEKEIFTARNLNPLNTDHTANLARLYDVWATYTDDSALKDKLIQKSAQNYQSALKLSPNNSRLWGEWSMLLFNKMKKHDEALQALDHAINLDPTYDWLHIIRGDYYTVLASEESNLNLQENYYKKSLQAYNEAEKYTPTTDISGKYRILFLKGNVFTHLKEYQSAIEAYLEALKIQPDSSDNWRILGILANIYFWIGDNNLAIDYARQALQVAPEDQKTQFENFIREIEDTP